MPIPFVASPKSRLLWILIFGLTQGCTAWKNSGSFFRTEQSKLVVESSPPSRIFVNNEYIGNTPAATQLEYQRQVDKKTREVNYWMTQPGWSLFFTLASLGIYLPLSLIPVDTETSLTPTETFTNNEFAIRLERDGYQTWEKKVSGAGQPTISLSPALQPKTDH